MIGIIAVGGEPATGKSTVFKRAMIALNGLPTVDKLMNVPCVRFDKAKVLVLGVYDDGTFTGTDRLSMTIIKNVKLLIAAMIWDEKENWLHWRIWLEGDRLMNATFLDLVLLNDLPYHFVMIEASEEAKAARHTARDNQSATWLKGRVTKYANLLHNYPSFHCLWNNDEADIATNAAQLCKWDCELAASLIVKELGY